ncbi:SpoIIIAH-like family protein [Paenisporosarcina cavernae]|uniref:SpoIIIAH-like family protein n=1 Tax=Paenisporosarcina cavernae TaxID=2320858 RepID=A0A385YSN8_9BACL|nr:SpoIIIAH-like family protein [Paenisporosarcina cavernae]AYC29544.1 SpoIIIAH-like family protein [Paenisporosarcina cavernae]
MKVKRRNVWLLTLLSLVAVISVYYANEPKSLSLDGVSLFTDQAADILSNTDEDETTPVMAPSTLFEDMRLELQDERSQVREQLTSLIASDTATAEEKNEAYSKMEQLTKQSSAEAMLEMLIQSLGYSDAFVKTDGEKVYVHVQSEEESKALANEIIYTVRKEWENAREVSVQFDTND